MIKWIKDYFSNKRKYERELNNITYNLLCGRIDGREAIAQHDFYIETHNIL